MARRRTPIACSMSLMRLWHGGDHVTTLMVRMIIILTIVKRTCRSGYSFVTRTSSILILSPAKKKCISHDRYRFPGRAAMAAAEGGHGSLQVRYVQRANGEKKRGGHGSQDLGLNSRKIPSPGGSI